MRSASTNLRFVPVAPGNHAQLPMKLATTANYLWPCAISRSTRHVKTQPDATALCHGGSRLWLQRNVKTVCGCHGLAPWRFTLVATKERQDGLRMPRPCAVELHVCGYKGTSRRFADATALRRGASRLRLQRNVKTVCGCHGLAPWSFTFVATKERQDGLRMPRPCAVELHVCGYKGTSRRFADATALRRGASRLWLKLITKSIKRETPRRKAVASIIFQ